MTTHKQKLEKRIYDAWAKVAAARGELYYPWVNIKNSEWSDEQTLELIGPALDRFMVRIEEAEADLTALLQDLAAEDRL